TESIQYDTNNNATIRGLTADGLTSLTVTTTYVNPDTNWILDRISDVKTTNGSTLLNEVQYVWTGNVISSIKNWLNTTKGGVGDWVIPLITFYADGAIQTLTEPAIGDGRNRTTTISSYDPSFFVHPATITDPLSHPTPRAYNLDGSLYTSTD